MTVEAPPRPPRTAQPDLEALIEEARQRARRRRLLLAASALLALAVVGSVSVSAYFLAKSKGGRSERASGAGSSPKGHLLLFGSLTHGHVIYSVRPDGTHLRRLARAGSQDFSLSPDQKRIVFTRGERPPAGRNTALFVLDFVSGRAQRITRWAESGTYRHPLWVLGGSGIVYAACRPFRPECKIMSIRANGSGARNLTSGVKTNGWAAVSPDGQSIAFTTTISALSFPTPGKVYVERIDGSRRRILTSGVISGASAWLSSGIVAENIRQSFDVVSLSGERRRLLPHQASAPVPSPDGKQMAFGVGSRLYVADAQGTIVRHINPSRRRVDPWQVAWSPDGTQLAYTEDRPHAHSSIVVVNVRTGWPDSVIPFKKPTWVVAWSR